MHILADNIDLCFCCSGNGTNLTSWHGIQRCHQFPFHPSGNFRNTSPCGSSLALSKWFPNFHDDVSVLDQGLAMGANKYIPPCRFPRDRNILRGLKPYFILVLAFVCEFSFFFLIIICTLTRSVTFVSFSSYPSLPDGSCQHSQRVVCQKSRNMVPVERHYILAARRCGCPGSVLLRCMRCVAFLLIKHIP